MIGIIKKVNSKIKCQIVGDDLFVTNKKRLEKGLKKNQQIPSELNLIK